ncbi:MAG TPA: hypothetical protein VGL57_12375 [Solirubrobacteraceae bacterium]
MLAADAQAQVYEAANQVFGCAYGQRHVYALGPGFTPNSGPGEEAKVKALTGPVVAVERFKNSARNQLIVVSDLRTGRIIRKVHTGGPPHIGPCFICDGVAVTLALKEDGSLAWMIEDGRFNILTELHAVDRTGSRILASGQTDEGTGIGLKSLVLNGSTLRWTQGGKPFSATLN